MISQEDLTETIRQNAQAPAKATGDSGSVEQQPLEQVMKSDRYLKSIDAMKQKRKGIRFAKLVPPGAD